MTIDPARLEVHVLGAGKGESIILRLPNGGRGVSLVAPKVEGVLMDAIKKLLRD